MLQGQGDVAEQIDQHALRNLHGDGRLSELDHFVPPLQIIRSLGIERDEVAHSRLLAALLDPRQHRGAEAMLRALLRGILERQSLANGTDERLREVLGALWTKVIVHREFRLIDIVAHIASSKHAVVVGIENKIDAEEGKEQIGRYQGVLERAFPGQTSLMVFLKPTGRESTTAISPHPVPAISAGYEVVAEAAEDALRITTPGSRHEHALSAIVAHLKENILGEHTEVRALVRQLWREHGKALRLAMKHRPRLEDVRGLYETLLRERFDDDAYIYYWQPRGELREIKMILTSWQETGFPFQFILCLNDEGAPLVRLLIWRDSYDENATSLKKWARGVNASDPNLVDDEFTKLRNWWGWRRVFLEEDAPPNAILVEQAFDEATAKEAAEAVVALYEKLKPYTKGK